MCGPNYDIFSVSCHACLQKVYNSYLNSDAKQQDLFLPKAKHPVDGESGNVSLDKIDQISLPSSLTPR